MPAREITGIVNTGDDFRHLGLHISHDIDTLLYTLSGKANRAQGWGRKGESWNFMDALRSLGGEDWFALGDGDMALHVLLTLAMARGQTLPDITRAFAAAWTTAPTLLRQTAPSVSTGLTTDQGWTACPRFSVERKSAPR